MHDAPELASRDRSSKVALRIVVNFARDENDVRPNNLIDQSIFLGNSSRPITAEFVLERFWFAQAAEWISRNVFDELKNLAKDLRILG
jgi:hypothetical protein